MTTDDLLLLSIGVNIALLYVNYKLNDKYTELGCMFAKLMFVMKGIADSEVDVSRDRDGNIRIKEKVNGN